MHVPPPAVWKALEKQARAEDEESAPAASGRDVSIKVRGEKEKVKAVVSHILQQYEELVDSLRELKISIPKRQHRFLVGAAADDILEQTGCIVELPPVDDASDQCVIRGPQPALIPALSLVMDKANAVAVEMVDVVALHRSNTSDPVAHAKRVLRFLVRSSRLRNIADAHAGVKVYPPFLSVVNSTGTVVIELSAPTRPPSPRPRTRSLPLSKPSSPRRSPPSMSTLSSTRCSSARRVPRSASSSPSTASRPSSPPASDESSEVMLFYAGDVSSLPATRRPAMARSRRSSRRRQTPSRARQGRCRHHHRDAHRRQEMAPVHHRQGGKTLNDLIGEDQLVNVKVGSKAGTSGATDEDTVVVRGPKGEVERVVSQIKQIVEDAKNDDLVNGYTVEFTVDKNTCLIWWARAARQSTSCERRSASASTLTTSRRQRARSPGSSARLSARRTRLMRLVAALTPSREAGKSYRHRCGGVC